MLRVNNISRGVIAPPGPVFENRSLDYSTANQSSYTIELPQNSSPGLAEVLFDGNGPGDRAWLIFVVSEDADGGTPTLSGLTLEGSSILSSQLQTDTQTQLYCSSYLLRPPTLASGDADFVVDFGSFDTQFHCAVHIIELSNVNSVTPIDSAIDPQSGTEVDQGEITVSTEPGALVVFFLVSESNATPSLTRSGFFAGDLVIGPLSGSLGSMGYTILGKYARGAGIGDFQVSTDWASGDMIANLVAIK